jgi:Zn-dependent protease with chaperone function
MTSVPTFYYDGTSSKRHAVLLTAAHGGLSLQGEGLERVISFGDMRIAAKLGSSPRLVYLADGSHFEVTDHVAFERVLHEAGLDAHTLVAHFEGSWRYALVALLLCIACGLAGFRWGLPWAARLAAERIPYSTAHIIDKQAMDAFDKGLLQPSKLPQERRQLLQHRFETLVIESGLPQLPLQFRYSKAIGANAFALPGGTVVVTDDLVQMADNDDEVIAVLAHELGHVKERHSLRQLLQSSAAALFMTWYVGDISNLLAAAPTLLVQANYSRAFETRADHYAVKMMRMNGIPVERLADMLRKLEASQRDRKERSSFGELFASHPATEKRIHDLYDYDSDE